MALQLESTTTEKTSAGRESPVSTFKLPSLARKAGATDRMFFTEQLALLLETGESLHGALTTIVSQTENPAMRKVVEKIALEVSEGRSFGSALASHEDIFSTTYINLISASEAGGFMHDVLQQLLVMERKREELRATLVSAATYPAFLISFSVAVVIFVLVVVFPKFGSMFASIYDQLPATTRGLMTISDILRGSWWMVLGGLAGSFLAIRHWLQTASGRARVDHWQLHVPLLRDIFTQVYLVQSLQVMSMSLLNGVSVMDALDSCRDVVRNTHFRRLIANVEDKVQTGAGVAAGFQEADFIPALAKHMISTGEQTGNLGKVMGRVAEHYEAQLAKRLDKVSKLAEPVMLLVMGVIVGVLVSSLILPIFKLSRAVS